MSKREVFERLKPCLFSVPTCYWVQNYQTGQVLTVPNQSNTAGTALVAAAKQSPTNGYQLWVRQGVNALSSLPTGQWLTVADQSTNGMTPAVIQPQTPNAANQSWVIPGYGDGAISFNRQMLNSYALAPIDQTTEQTPVVLRSPDDFRYNNAGNSRNKWWLVQASPLDCLAALPVHAASVDSTPAITQSAAPLSPEQAPVDAQANLQRVYLPLVNK